MSGMKTLPVVVLALSAVSVPAFRLSGVVRHLGSNLPLSGATVSLANSSAVSPATTNAAGEFLLTDQGTGTERRESRAKELRGGFEGRDFVVRGAGAGAANLEILGLDGKRALVVRARETGSGELRFALPTQPASGMALLRLRQDGVTATWTRLALVDGAPRMAARTWGAGARVLAEGLDTLVVTKIGMTDIRIALPPGAGTTSASLESPVAMQAAAMGRMRFIPGGRFLMGDSLLPASLPRIHRTVEPFWMDTLLPTRGEFVRLGFPQISDDSLPAEGNWMRMVRYCNLRSAAEGLPPAYVLTPDSMSWGVRPGATGYRLPTEAEWEYAARAGASTGWYWGDDSSKTLAGQYAMYTTVTQGNPLPVGTLKPNGFGLRDMAGNSWEWTEDLHGPYAKDDVQPIPVAQPGGCHRVMRGGAWTSPAIELRSGFRRHELPVATGYIGGRCVRTAFPATLPAPAWAAFPVQGRQRRIPGGDFRMGDSLQDSAMPIHLAHAPDLWVDTVLVTGDEYFARTGLKVFGQGNRPADVSWHKAVRYCNARSIQEGLDPVYELVADSSNWTADTSKNGYRLPTEAEWEFLARGGASTGWWWGDDSSWQAMTPNAWWSGNSIGNAQDIALKAPNPFGLYDMVGNHSQWTEDRFGLYKQDGSRPDPLPMTYGTHRVYRGGAWFSPATALRSGWRKHDLPLAGGYIGFRCVRTAR